MSARPTRRALLAGLLAAPALAFVRPDTLPLKKAVFEEIAASVQMTLSLPALFRKTDKEALASIDSGFDTTLQFEVDLWEHGTRRQLASRSIVVKIRRDPWSSRYVVRTQGSTGWVRRTFTTRDAAIEAAVTLDRVRICDAALLQRGTQDDGPFYFVTVLAMRNPIKDAAAPGRRRRRGGDRDLEWFGRLVDALAGERARAEELVQTRTNPFFLLSR